MALKNKMIHNMNKDRNVLVVGTGWSIKKYSNEISDYIKLNNAIVIGINDMTSLCIPDYHMWTNKKRYTEFGSCVSKSSEIIIGGKMTDNLVRMHFKGSYIRIKHIKDDNIRYEDNIIYGNFRTCGILAIMVAHIMGAKNISVVGMDGYTLYPKKTLKKGSNNHHCYGQGYTDDADWDKCLLKDKLVNNELLSLKKYGIDFQIITPTKFNDFYKAVLIEVQ